MKRFRHCLPAAALFAALAQAAWAGAGSVTESARKIPVAYDVDVVVVGGSTGAVAAAVEAARGGASVFLAAGRPYLGQDVCGTLRLWLAPGETPTDELAKAVFRAPAAAVALPPGLAFTYEASRRAGGVHPDTDPPSLLTDGKWSGAPKQSVQYDGDVTIMADLGGERRLASVHVLVYQRPRDFEVRDVTVWTSRDRKAWTRRAAVKNPHLGTGGHEKRAVAISAAFAARAQYVKLQVAGTPRAGRILLGEVIIASEPAAAAAPSTAPHAVTPMQVKRALDDALLAAKVKFLYGCLPTDVLRDSAGRPAGIVMANRAGRQAVTAKVIIDATTRATVARLAGAAFGAYPAGPQTFRRVVVGGRAKGSPGASPRKLDFTLPGSGRRYGVVEYTLTIPMPNGSFASFAAAEQTARDRTFDPAQVDSSDVLFQVPPDPVKARARAKGDWPGADKLDLDALRPGDLERLYVLGGCADVDRAAAAKLLRPLALMRVGRRVGAAAAAEAKALPGPAGVHVPARKPPPGSKGDVREALAPLRPATGAAGSVPSPAGALELLGEYDVVVVGGGTGGAPAGIAAARSGARTLVVEYQNALGGVGTVGMISDYYWGWRAGFTAEVDRGVAAMGGPKAKKGWNIQCKQEWWRRALRRAGADVWFSSLGCGAVVAGARVGGVVVATPHGRGVVRAKVVIDSTGNADIAAAAGAACTTTGAEHAAMQGTGLPPRTLGRGYTNTDYSFVSDSDPVDVWRMLVTARRRYAGAYDVGTLIDSRERRRIVGDAFVTPLDILNGRTYADTVSIHNSNFDTHGFTVHPVFMVRFPDKRGMTAYLPYRCLLPKGLDGILVTGLGVSAHRDAMPILRMQPCIQNQGYAAGVAASMSADENLPTRAIDVRRLQKHLAKVGNLTPQVLEHRDSPPPGREKLAEAVRQVADQYKGLEVILAAPEAALPLLREAHGKAAPSPRRLAYAQVLGMMGDAAGAGTLAEAVAAARWDRGWNFRGMGQFGSSLSRLDSLIIALGRTGDKRALGPILEKVRQLDASKDYSHHRAVALALEALRDPAACAALAELLGKPGMTGHAMTDVTGYKIPKPEHRSPPLREIVLARALYTCGDHDGVGEKILKHYERDLRGLFARHAQAVLKRR